MIRNLIPALLWSVFVILLSIVPGNEFPQFQDKFKDMDKFAHAFMYAGLSFLWFYGLRRSGITKLKKVNIDIIVSISILISSIALEIIQHFYIPNRHFDMFDVAANGIGILIGFTSFYFVIYRRI